MDPSRGLIEALGIVRGDVVSVAGAGGKTTLVYALADEARERGWRTLVTTTTHMGTLPQATTGPVFVDAEGQVEAGLEAALGRDGRATLLGRRVREDKLEGVSPERVDALAPQADLLLVEADGARGRSLKVPAGHEPVLPGSTTLLVVVAALDVLGQPLAEGHVHRVDRVAAAVGKNAGSRLDAADVVAALTHASGYPSRVPPRVRSGVFLNKVEDDAAWAAAGRIAPAVQAVYGVVAAGTARGGLARSWPWS